jgi:hypothetical protein
MITHSTVIENSFDFPFVQTDAGRSASKRPKQSNDCTVRAWAAANNIAYDEAYDYLKSFGRKSHKGIHFNNFAKSHDDILIKFTFPAVKGQTRMNIEAFCKQYSKGKFIIKTAKHVLAVIDGVAYDDARPSPTRCVYCAYKVNP